jgi:hypothetical protein
MPRKKSSGILDWIADFSIHSFLLHPASLFLAVTIVVLIGSAALWKQHSTQIANEQFRLTADKIQLTQQPPWIRSNLKENVVTGSSLDDSTLLDGDVVQKVRDAFAVDPWVEKVVKIQKSADSIDVTVEYRKPVAMVEFGGKHLLPVDRNGIVLDGREFKSEQVRDFLRISVRDPVNGQILTGKPWPDSRVIAGAKIAALWETKWQDAGLFRIVNQSNPPRNDNNQTGLFQIWTEKNSKLVWGNEPGREVDGEATTDKKIKAILLDVQQNGSLDSRSKQMLDVRSGVVQPISLMRKVSHQQKK